MVCADENFCVCVICIGVRIGFVMCGRCGDVGDEGGGGGGGGGVCM